METPRAYSQGVTLVLTSYFQMSKIADYLSCFTIFDKEKMIDQEIRTRAKSDCCRGHTDPKPNQIWSNMPHSKDYSKFKSIQSWTECKYGLCYSDHFCVGCLGSRR